MKSVAPHSQPSRGVQVDALRQSMESMLDGGQGRAAVSMLLDLVTELQVDNAKWARRAFAAERALFLRKSEKLTPEELRRLVAALGGSQKQAGKRNPKIPTPAPNEENVSTADQPSEGPSSRATKKGKHRGRSKLSDALPRHVNLTQVPARERSCVHCGACMQPAGHVDHERIEFVPARVEVHIDRREKVACKTCKQDITIAPRPTRLGEAAPDEAVVGHGIHVYRRAGTSLMAFLLESKCDDGMPVYRQRQQMARLGFQIPLNTLYGYWRSAAALVQPIAQAILSNVLGSPVVGVDDTRLDWLDPAQKSRRRRGHLWCFTGEGPLVAFEFTRTWRAEDVAPWLRAIDGMIQCDDYKGYSAKLKVPHEPPQPLVAPDRRLGCWMHVRRRFFKAYKANELAGLVGLKYIGELYRIEAAAREAGMASEARAELRRRESIAVAKAFFAWVDGVFDATRPASYLGKALRYARDQQPYVMRCLSDGRFELDTGRVERAIREPVIGRKNYLFSGSADSARLLAGVYTLVCSCQNAGIDTRAYLVDIMERLQAGFPLRRINDLLPNNWKPLTAD